MCEQVTEPSLIKHQRENSYMKDYPPIIEYFNAISPEEYWSRYRKAGSNYGRHMEGGEIAEDGMVVRKHDREDVVFEDLNLCEQCRVKEVSEYLGWGGTHKVLDCRTPQKEQEELAGRVNED